MSLVQYLSKLIDLIFVSWNVRTQKFIEVPTTKIRSHYVLHNTLIWISNCYMNSIIFKIMMVLKQNLTIFGTYTYE